MCVRRGNINTVFNIMSFFQYTLLLIFLPGLLAKQHSFCTEEFYKEIQKLNVTQHCHLKEALQTEFGWNYNNDTRRLDIVYGARLDAMTGWLAWGLNLHNVGMVGTQALIGVKYGNGSLVGNKYNVTQDTKRGCQLEPSDDIGLDVHNFSFGYLERIQYYVIQATLFLPPAYNCSKTDIVYQIGQHVSDRGPLIHRISLGHLDTAETMNLVTNEQVNYYQHTRQRLREVHGILNVGGWGTLLPIGVIIARYFKKIPFESEWWDAGHVLFQCIGYIVGLVGWAIGLWLGNASKHYCFNTHRILGIVIFTLATMQALAGKFRPLDSGENRKYWNMYHHSLGYILLALISVNMFIGIRIMEPNYKWKWAYIGILGVLGCVALALEGASWVVFNRNKKKESNKNSPSTKDQNASTKSVKPKDQNASTESVKPIEVPEARSQPPRIPS